MDEITLRKQAIQMWLSGHSKQDIANQMKKSWFWVHYWIGRYQPDHPLESLQDRPSTPKKPYQGWSEEIHQMVLNSRKARVEREQPGYQYALKGAQAIQYELQELGVVPLPSVRTIHGWLKGAELIGPSEHKETERKDRKVYPAPNSDSINALHEFDLKGPFYLSGSAQKHYLYALRDAHSKRVALGVGLDKQTETLIDFLVSAWNRLGLPQVLQMDNGLEFRGSNRYPRSFGKLIRVALDLAVQPLFIPQHEPWRNGVIENLNGLLERLFFEPETFQDFAQLAELTKAVEQAINTTHRLAALDGKTPAEFAQDACLRKPPQAYDWRLRDLQLVKGKIAFIRLVRKSGRITLCADDKFEIGEELQWQYICAVVDLSEKRLDIFFQERLIKSFDF